MDNVVFRYFEKGSRNILDHVELDIEEGGITVIMGGSGCGKSTLAAVVSGLYPENGGFLECGEIDLFGIPLRELDPQKRAAYMTILFQNADLQFCMDTLRGEMRFCLENLCVPREEMDERLEAAAKLTGVYELLDRKLFSLSGGEKQKAALSCLSLMNSRCIVLDEIFANIDPSSVAELIGLLKTISDSGTTIIAIDHRLDYWLDCAKEVIILTEGGKTAARGICKDNVQMFRNVFEQEGIFFPGDNVVKSLHSAAALPNTKAIELEHVSIYAESPIKKPFRKPIQSGSKLLDNISFSIAAGTMSALVGRSGSGKTTTFLSILKQHPYQGTIRVFGTDISSINARTLYQQVGIVFQNPANQFITQNVLDEVKQSIRVWNNNIDEDTLVKQAEEKLNSYGLARYKKYSPYMLSQGQQRRLAVLSVLCGNQKLLLLDEPTYGQDQKSVNAIMEQLRQLMQERQLTVIFITHDLALAEQWADCILELKGGDITDDKTKT